MQADLAATARAGSRASSSPSGTAWNADGFLGWFLADQVDAGLGANLALAFGRPDLAGLSALQMLSSDTASVSMPSLTDALLFSSSGLDVPSIPVDMPAMDMSSIQVDMPSISVPDISIQVDIPSISVDVGSSSFDASSF